MPQYSVLEPLKRNGQGYAPGDTVEMEPREARELLALGVLAPAPKAAPQTKPEAKGKSDAKDEAKPKAEAKPEGDGKPAQEGGAPALVSGKESGGDSAPASGEESGGNSGEGGK